MSANDAEQAVIDAAIELLKLHPSFTVSDRNDGKELNRRMLALTRAVHNLKGYAR